MLAACANQLLLFPTTDPIDVPTGTRRTIPMPEGGVVEAWVGSASQQSPQAVVLRFCGNGERAEFALVSEQEEWGGLPVEIWAVNYPGFGGSTGPASLHSIPVIALAAFDFLHARQPGGAIFLSGFSMGATAALHVAANRPVAGLLLHNPPPLRQLILGSFGWWNLWLLAGPIAMQVPAQLDSLANGSRAGAPAVFLISEADTIVPARYQRKVVNAYAGPKRVVLAQGANHNTPIEAVTRRELRERIAWLCSALDR